MKKIKTLAVLTEFKVNTEAIINVKGGGKTIGNIPTCDGRMGVECERLGACYYKDLSGTWHKCNGH